MKIPPRTITLNDTILLCYAVLDEHVGYTVGHGLFFVDGKEIGRIPRLAICKDKDSGLFTLYYCDEDWNPLGVAADYQTVALQRCGRSEFIRARRRAGQIMPE